MSKYLTATCVACAGPCDYRAASKRCYGCRYTTRSTVDRIADRITIDSNGCWIWQGCCNRGGYGQVNAGDKTRLTHRVTYEHYVGPVPDGLELDHLCRVRRCCNPDHLEPVTRSENMLRSPIAGRYERNREVALS